MNKAIHVARYLSKVNILDSRKYFSVLQTRNNIESREVLLSGLKFDKDVFELSEAIKASAKKAFIEYKIYFPKNTNKMLPSNYLNHFRGSKGINSMKPTYVLTSLHSMGKGTGTLAIQDVVEKSLFDNQTMGRVILHASCVDGKTSPLGFYYKMGFRSVEKKDNLACEKWLKSGGKKENAPWTDGSLLYMPMENISSCLAYGYK